MIGQYLGVWLSDLDGTSTIRKRKMRRFRIAQLVIIEFTNDVLH